MQITRVFADKHRFYIYDSNFDHYSAPSLKLASGNFMEYGYLTSNRCIYVSTVSSLNDHAVRVFVDAQPTKSYERIFEDNIDITSGILIISGHVDLEEDIFSISVSSGKYSILICANSVGKDMFSYDEDYDEEMSDAEYFTHDEFEHYDVFLNRLNGK